MAVIETGAGWTKTELGDGWVKLVEIAGPFGSSASDEIKSTPITNSTLNAVSNGPSMPLINELKKAGSFMLQVTTGAGASLNCDTSILMKDSAGTYRNSTGVLIADMGLNHTAHVSYAGATTDSLKITTIRDAGTAANPITYTITYYNGGPNQSDLTIAGVGADPS